MNAAPPTSGKAVLSLILGLLSGVLFIVTGLPALLLGFLGLREVNRSDGRLRGAGLAVAGMVLGGVGSLLFLVGLLALVLMNLREKANRVVCENNLRLIGFALNHYYDRHDVYPSGTIPNDRLPPGERLSWLVALLPYLEEPPASPQAGPTAGERLYEQINKHRAWTDPANLPPVSQPVRWVRCPSDTGKHVAGSPDPSDYVGTAGLGTDAATLLLAHPQAGFFGYDRRLTRQEITGGISNTVMSAETGWENGPWAAGGPATVRGLDPDRRPYTGPGRPFGGLHPVGFNTLFVDGSVHFLRDSVEPAVFEKLIVIHRQEPVE